MTERTTAELAALLKLSQRRTLALMQESAALGLVELVGEHWRLTAHAEREFGQALRELDNAVEDASEYAVHRRHGAVMAPTSTEGVATATPDEDEAAA